MSEKKEQSLTSDEDKESIENDTLKSKDIENSDEVLETNSNNEELSTEDINKELEAKIEDLRDQLMRTLADSENLRKRTLKEIEHSKKYSHISFVRDLVSLFDNLQRALDAVPDDKSKLSEPIKNLIVGLELVNKEIINTFEKHNLKQIEPLGEKFDYNLHEAMYEVPTNDEETGIVVEVSQKGYLLYDRLVRPAMVGISKKIEDEKNNNGKTKKI